jgi:hypothetical protein
LPLSHLTDVEIANIINYINKTYGDKGDFVTPEQVKIDLENCE